jgi:hypothetical protein
MLKRRTSPLQVGHRLSKTGQTNGRIWEIVDLRIAVDGHLHARLESCGARKDSITISAFVLSDPQFWVPIVARTGPTDAKLPQ